MWEIWTNLLLPKALKSCPKSNKLPNLVTLILIQNSFSTSKCVSRVDGSLTILIKLNFCLFHRLTFFIFTRVVVGHAEAQHQFRYSRDSRRHQDLSNVLNDNDYKQNLPIGVTRFGKISPLWLNVERKVFGLICILNLVFRKKLESNLANFHVL